MSPKNQAALLAVVLAFTAAARGACAEASLDAESLNVYSPQITQGEREVESILFTTQGRQQGYAFSAGYSPTSYWAAEVYEVYHRDPGSTLATDAVEVENRFAFGAPGQYWLDLGAIVEFEIPQQPGDHGVAQFAPILEKQLGPALLSLNLPLQWQYGPGYTPGAALGYAARAEYLLSPALSPALEAYGQPAASGRLGGMSGENHFAGPAAYGSVLLASFGTVRYSIAPLIGMTPASPSWTLVGRLELEF